MESRIKSSFIPKKPIAQASSVSKATYKSGGVDIAMLVAVVLLVISGVLSGGVFLYKNLAISDADNKKEQLQKARGAFEPRLIQELMQLSDRIRVAEGILENHTAPSIFLQALERDTLSGVQFIDFDYKQKNTGIAVFSLKGKTGSVNSVALQSSRFGESLIIKDPIFSDIDLIKDGVTFTVEGEIDLAAIRFAAVAAQPFTQEEESPFLLLENEASDFGDFGSTNTQSNQNQFGQQEGGMMNINR